MAEEYKICVRCVMDTSDRDIRFDEHGICSNCRDFEKRFAEINTLQENNKEKLHEIVAKIKKSGINSEYDCLTGVSGGVDSTYLCLQLKKLGLRTLVVHFDNGWDSELAVKNIEHTVKKLDFDLFTYVVNWEEFKDIEVAYLKSSVLDLEAVTDHAIIATLYQTANENGIKYIINGSNFVTEGILPQSWRYENKMDLINLKAIHKQFGKVKLKTFPTLGIFKYLYYRYVKKIHVIDLLNYLPYNKNEAKKTIINELGWRDYGGKHHESIITRFYQTYILPTKFKIEKRRAHLSTLICSGQITREDALKELEKPICDPVILKEDMDYVPKKLGLSADEFKQIMQTPPRSHYDFPNEKKYLDFFIKLKKILTFRS